MDGLAAGLAAPIGLAAGGFVTGLVRRMVGPRSAGGPARTAVTMITAAVFAAVAARFGISWAVIVPLILAAALVALSAIDLYLYRLPDPITFAAFGASLVAMAAVSPAAGGFGILTALAGAAGYGAVLWTVHEISPRGLGFGDVKLGFLCGLHLGWVAGVFHAGWSSVVGLVTGALLVAGAVGVAGGLVVAGLRRRGCRVLPDPSSDPGSDPGFDPDADPGFDPDANPGLGAGGHGCGRQAPPRQAPPVRLIDNSFPFGPALAAGAMVAVLFSEAMAG